LSVGNPYDEVLSFISRERDWAKAIRLIEQLGLDLETFIVYYDLKKRGKKVTIGPRPRTLIYSLGPGRAAEVLILSEGTYVKPMDIVAWSERAVADAHEPVVAIVDETGGVTYYEARVIRGLA